MYTIYLLLRRRDLRLQAELTQRPVIKTFDETLYGFDGGNALHSAVDCNRLDNSIAARREDEPGRAASLRKPISVSLI